MSKINNLTSLISLLILLIPFSGMTQELPIFTEKLQKGAYVSFEEFKFNSPSITDSLIFDRSERKNKNWTGTYSVTPRFANSDRKVKKVWGFCDGEKAYYFHEIEFFEIDLTDNKFVFYGYGNVSEDAIAAATVLGGAIGAGIASAATYSSAKSKRIRYHIDQINGYVEKLTNVAYDKVFVQPDVYLVFYRHDKKELPGTVHLTVNDSINIDLENYSYDQIKFKVSKEPIKIEYEDGVDFLTIDIKNESNKYVEVSNSSNEKKEKLLLQDFNTGDYYAKKAKKRQLEREKGN